MSSNCLRPFVSAMIVLAPICIGSCAVVSSSREIVDYPHEGMSASDDDPNEVIVYVYDVRDLIDGPTWEQAPSPQRRSRHEFTPMPDESRYEVAPGDSLSLIARRLYGREANWSTIADCNGIRDGVGLHAGQSITIPAWTPADDRAEGDASRQDELRSQLISRIQDYLASRRIADVPAEAPHIQVLNSNLIITASRRDQAGISDFLSSLRDTSSIQVGVESSVLFDARDLIAKQHIEFFEPKAGIEPCGVTILTQNEAKALQDGLNPQNQSTWLRLSRLTAFTGDTASVGVDAATPIVMGLVGERSGHAEVEMAEGTHLHAGVQVSDDRGSVVLDLRMSSLSVDRVGGKPVEWRAVGETSVIVPDGGAALLRVPCVPFELVDVTVEKDERTGESRASLKRRLADIPVKQMYVLVRPEIIILQANEQLVFPGLEDALKR